MKRILSWIFASVLLFGILSAFASTDTPQVVDTTATATETPVVEIQEEEFKIEDETPDSVTTEDKSEAVTEVTEIETVTDTKLIRA